MKMSQEAFEDIVEDEVTSEAVYRKKYQKPEWPGASSGVTVGIGYDLGQTSASTIRSDWAGRVPDAMLELMVSCSGVTGQAAKPLTARVRDKINIPWETAIAVHKERVVPRWEAKVAANLPNTDLLSGDCYGALVSLVFNRGPSFRMNGDRYTEMRNIRSHMMNKRFDRVDDEIIHMKRLWEGRGLPGLLKRRDREAVLWNKGLPFIKSDSIVPTVEKEKRAKVLAETPAVNTNRTPKPDPIDPEETGDEASAPHGEKSVELEVLQTELKDLGYHMVGLIDGKWGGATAGAIAAFKNDRHLPGPPVIDDELKEEIDRAKKEGWKRPISEERKEGLPENSRIIEASEKQGGVAAVTTGVGAIGILGKAKEHVESLKGVIDPVMGWISPFTDLIKDYWWVLLSAGGIYVLIQAAKTRKARIEDHQKGVTP